MRRLISQFFRYMTICLVKQCATCIIVTLSILSVVYKKLDKHFFSTLNRTRLHEKNIICPHDKNLNTIFEKSLQSKSNGFHFIAKENVITIEKKYKTETVTSIYFCITNFKNKLFK